VTRATTDRLRIAVLGVLGQSPFAGVSWQVLPYLEGFRRLGHVVTYVEDTGEWPYDPVHNVITADPAYTIGYLQMTLATCGLQSSWFYRSAAEGGRVYGGEADALARTWREADVLVNLTGATVLREEHLGVPVRVYLETDPVLPEIEVLHGNPFTIEQLGAHTHIATFAENFGTDVCPVPLGPYAYVATRQPVVVDWWQPPRPRRKQDFTTVASWRQSGKDIDWAGDTFTWSKHVEFEKVLGLPSRLPRRFVLALSGTTPADVDRLKSHGWEVRDALGLSADPDRYRSFIRSSLGEFTVAKDQNVRLRSGWFSDRSACYLAAGLPVVTQDTGFGTRLPTGVGLMPFQSLDDAVEAIAEITADPAKHEAGATDLARSYFEATTVLADLLAAVGLA
jgi:hypothetical protein